MALYKRGNAWWYSFLFAGRRIQESAKTHSKTLAKEAEKRRHRELEEGYNDLGDSRRERVQTIREAAATYLGEYALKHRSVTFANYAVGHVTRLLGDKMLVDVGDKAVKAYQVARLKEETAPKTINEEVGFLLRLLGDNGDAIRGRLRKQKALKLSVPPSIGRAFSDEEKERLLTVARASKSPMIYPALCLALNAGMRDAEIRNLTWGRVDLGKRFLVVGKSKSAAGQGRTIPLNSSLLSALLDHSQWYMGRFGLAQPDWYLFPSGKSNLLDPARPITTLKTAWTTVRERAAVNGRWHDARHTLITNLAEAGAGDQTIMDIAGHVSRQTLARYSHIRMEAKRRALEAIEAKAHKQQAAADSRTLSTMTSGAAVAVSSGKPN